MPNGEFVPPGYKKRGRKPSQTTYHGRSRVRGLLWAMYERLGSWHRVAEAAGCDVRLAWNVAHGQRRASRSLRMALGLIGPPKPRVPWKKLYLELTGAQARAGVELSQSPEEGGHDCPNAGSH
jgi:hypothetical protein